MRTRSLSARIAESATGALTGALSGAAAATGTVVLSCAHAAGASAATTTALHRSCFTPSLPFP